MGYEIAGGLGVKMADPSRDIYVMVGDGSYLMLHTELVTSLQEGYKLIIVLVDNSGYQCIRGLQMSSGSPAFGNEFRYRDPATNRLDGSYISIDFAQNAESLGAVAFRADTAEEFEGALANAKKTDRTTLIHVKVDVEARVPGFDSWWDVPIAQATSEQGVKDALEHYESARSRQRYFH
jgi:3D-(3,5/4)-trihydroxycyclohexane-1,2-dione acylhydrolase (decyclizing)